MSLFSLLSGITLILMFLFFFSKNWGLQSKFFKNISKPFLVMFISMFFMKLSSSIEFPIACFLFWMGLVLLYYFFVEFTKLSLSITQYFSHPVSKKKPLVTGFGVGFVEIISAHLRSLTMSLRLVFNLLGGYILFGVLFSSVALGWMYFFKFSLFFMEIYEIGVFLMQASVFSSLIYMYMHETVSSEKI